MQNKSAIHYYKQLSVINTAYAGLENRRKDKASYVLKQDKKLESKFTTPLTQDLQFTIT
jgi:hypothetical protein